MKRDGALGVHKRDDGRDANALASARKRKRPDHYRL